MNKRLAKSPPEEPDALVAHVRVCEGPGRRRPGLLDKRILLVIYLVAFFLFKSIAATHYVAVTNSLAADPYTNWATAGTNIIDVVNAAMTNAGTRVIWVSNGIYYLTNQISITNALTIQSVNGRELTIVNGNYPAYTNGCFNLSVSGAILDGFTITNGASTNSAGGAIGADGTTIRNCRITGCLATNPGIFNANGGGVRVVSGVMTNCEIIGNVNYGRYGGGVSINGALVLNCTVAKNICTAIGAQETGGGGIIATGGTVDACIVSGNICEMKAAAYGGGIRCADGTVVRNSLVSSNYSGWDGGGIHVYFSHAIIKNCTIASNRAASSGGGITIATLANKTTSLENVVCYLNAGGNSNIYFPSGAYTGFCSIVNSCIAPTSSFPTTGFVGYYYANNIQSNPQFVNKDSNNFHLAQGSPCINSGTNESWMILDLDGHSRIDRFSGVVDMGCCEYLPQGFMFSAP